MEKTFAMISLGCAKNLVNSEQMLYLMSEAGYTLRLIPGTPEENAPVFDFAAETIVQKAA